MTEALEVKFKCLLDTAKVPTIATDGAGCYDVYAAQSITIPQHVIAKVRTGLSLEIPPGYCAVLYTRSSMLANRGLLLTPTVIDSDYRGEVFVPLFNLGAYPCPQQIFVGDRIAQVKLEVARRLMFREATSLSVTSRGAGGFGSTGV